MLSPPSRRRGLKFILTLILKVDFYVASLAEAWIEIFTTVAAWMWVESPPSRRRGLKLLTFLQFLRVQVVASLAEAWIEIYLL